MRSPASGLVRDAEENESGDTYRVVTIASTGAIRTETLVALPTEEYQELLKESSNDANLSL